MIDPYADCPCGSGKQFKWCCQSYYPLVEKAASLAEQGQKEQAVRVLDQLVASHSKIPQSYGYKAQMLFSLERFEEADECLQKAFDIDPNFAFGHFLRGIIRHNEGELIGAVLEYRKAAELVDAKAIELQAQILDSLGGLELQFNRPLAARAALDMVARHYGSNPKFVENFEGLFGENSQLPLAARKKYTFRTAAKDNEAVWEKALIVAQTGRLTDAAKAFEMVVAQNANDASAHFNLGLVRAWLGDSPKAIDAIERSVAIETDEARNEEAIAICEVLRCAHGMTEQADYIENSIVFRMTSSEAIMRLLEEWQASGRMVGVQPDQQTGSLTALVLEDRVNLGMGIGNPVAPTAGYFFAIGEVLRIWHTNLQTLDKLATEMRLKLAATVVEAGRGPTQIKFGDVVLEAMAFPHQEAELEAYRKGMADQAEQYFEEKWLHRPLRSLSGMTPIDAAASDGYRKRLPGVIRFIEDCWNKAAPKLRAAENAEPVKLYDFDRLRRKLGLISGEQAQAAGADFFTMSAAELAAQDRQAMTAGQLEDCFRAALRLDANDLAGAFATALIAHPADGDRFPFFHHLIEQARQENRWDEILTLLDAAEKSDAESNESMRNGDYLLRRGQTLAKKGDVAGAVATFEKLVAGSPNELRLIGSATEATLGLKIGPAALQFAEQGLAKARSQKNRDSEQYFLELITAAKRIA